MWGGIAGAWLLSIVYLLLNLDFDVSHTPVEWICGMAGPLMVLCLFDRQARVPGMILIDVLLLGLVVFRVDQGISSVSDMGDVTADDISAGASVDSLPDTPDIVPGSIDPVDSVDTTKTSLDFNDVPTDTAGIFNSQLKLRTRKTSRMP